MSSCYRVSTNPLEISEVVKILQEPHENEFITLPPIKPKGGEIYLYQAGDDDSLKGTFKIIYEHAL